LKSLSPRLDEHRELVGLAALAGGLDWSRLHARAAPRPGAASRGCELGSPFPGHEGGRICFFSALSAPGVEAQEKPHEPHRATSRL